jgi:hypothetical protein
LWKEDGMKKRQLEANKSSRPRLWDAFRAEKIAPAPAVRAFGVRLFKD